MWLRENGCPLDRVKALAIDCPLQNGLNGKHDLAYIVQCEHFLVAQAWVRENSQPGQLDRNLRNEQ